MRDVNRIPHFMEILQKTWEKYPDWRFTQLICNTLGFLTDPYVFYLEDDEALDKLQIFLGYPD